MTLKETRTKLGLAKYIEQANDYSCDIIKDGEVLSHRMTIKCLLDIFYPTKIRSKAKQPWYHL
jgi:hypothetical protein